MRPPDTIVCKPIMISSCQQFLKSKIYKFKLTTHSTYKLFSQPWGLDLSHGRFRSLSWYYPFCHAPTIYLKSELQSTTHLVSLDAYNFFHCCNNHWSIFRIYKIRVLLVVNDINITKTHLIHAIIIILKLQGIVTSFMPKWNV